jgi:membrane protease YdiL (CAAX protease family)
LLRNRALDLINGITTPQVTYLFLAMGIALAEETIFRGYIQLRLGWWLGENKGWLVTGLFYAAFRFPVLLAAGDLNAALFGLLLALGQGLVAGWLMRKSGHVLAPALYRAVSIWMNVFI